MSGRVDRYLTGGLDREELAILAEELRDPAAARRLVRAAADEWGILQALQGQTTGERPPAPPRRRRPVRRPRARKVRARRPSLVVAGTLALAVAVALAWWAFAGEPSAIPSPRAPADPGRLETIAGPTSSEEPRRIPAGGKVRVPAGTTSVLHLADGSQIRIDGPAGLTVQTAHRLHCERGRLTASVVPRAAGSAWSLTTPHARCRVLGTVFELTVDAEGTVLTVTEGTVAFGDAAGGHERACASGDRASRSAGPPPLLRYPFVGRGEGLWACGEGPAERPPLTDDRPPRAHADGLLLTAEAHCVTATNSAWPELARRLRAAAGVTLVVRASYLAPPPENLLLAELHCKRTAPAGEDAPDSLLLQVRYQGRPDTARHCFATVWTGSGRLRRYRDGNLVAEDTQAFTMATIGDRVQLKLSLPRGHHTPPPGFAGVVVHDLRLYDRALTPDEVTAVSHVRPITGAAE